MSVGPHFDSFVTFGVIILSKSILIVLSHLDVIKLFK
jgi:hypothetical protein